MIKELSVVACTAVACWASSVHAQEVPIPFAPPLAANYIVSEQRTVTARQGGAEETSTMRARYRLEFHRSDTSFEVVWTVISAEATGPMTFPMIDPAPLVGIPISLLLDDAGNPTRVRNWDRIRPYLGEASDELGARLDVLSPATPADALATPLMSISPCHNTNLRIGEPERTEREYAVQRRFVRVSKELDEVDRSAGSARILFERVQGLRGEPLGASDGVLTTVRADCIVDLETGVTQSANASIVTESDDATVEVREIITVSRQSD